MSLFPVSAEKERQLLERMSQLGVREQDIEEQFVRSSGPGGQNVNKNATCVLLFHRPSGTRVRCQSSRSQGLNRYLARWILLDRIDARRRGALSAEQQKIEKIRRQKRRRSRRAKARMLADKRHQSEKKSMRGPVRSEG